MSGLNLLRTAVLTAAAGLLAGCGAPQLPVAPSVGQAAVRQPAGGGYLYVSTGGPAIYEFVYPSGVQVADITLGGRTFGACSDTNGNVFVTDQSGNVSGTIYEFANGGSKPSSTLTEAENAEDCSFDATTGNLAVVNASSGNYQNGSVAIYAGAQGTPVLRGAPMYFAEVHSCAYDDAGDLFIAGPAYRSGSPLALAELVKGASSFQQISLNQQVGSMGADYGVQWSGKELAVTELPQRGRGSAVIYRVAISGAVGSVNGSTTLETHSKKNSLQSAWTWIVGGSVLAPSRAGIEIWSYPKGGKRKALIIARGSFAQAVSLRR
jgi:hypothetical protein